MHHRSQFTASRFSNSAPDEVTTTYPTHSARRYTETKSSEISTDMFTRNSSSTSSDSDSHEFVESDVISTPTYASSAPTVDVESPVRRSGAHRLPTPPSALKGRAAVLAVAAGAVVAAGQAVVNDGSSSAADHSEVALANESSRDRYHRRNRRPLSSLRPPPRQPPPRPTLRRSSTSQRRPTSPSSATCLPRASVFSDERAAREAAARRPLFVLPAVGTFTSNFGTRWGTLHAGVDIAAPIGTPIVAVADGKVIDSGPASGFGMWVRLQHADGTITVYGHIDTSTVTVRSAGHGRRPDRHCRQPRLLHRPAPSLRGSSRRREQDRSPPLARLTRHQPRRRAGLIASPTLLMKNFRPAPFQVRAGSFCLSSTASPSAHRR